MKLCRPKSTISSLVFALTLTIAPVFPVQALTVFDPWNYQQNVLTAVRSLTEINQQVEQLRNEAQMLLRMDLDLIKLTGTISPQLANALSNIEALMARANAIAMQVSETDEAMARLFPNEYDQAISSDDIFRQVKTRWQETLAAYRRSASLQAQISENVNADANLLATLMARSQSSIGNLEVTQAGNELTALGVKQSLQLQQLLAAQYRAETLERARNLASEEEARIRFNSFLGDNTAYSPER